MKCILVWMIFLKYGVGGVEGILLGVKVPSVGTRGKTMGGGGRRSFESKKQISLAPVTKTMRTGLFFTCGLMARTQHEISTSSRINLAISKNLWVTWIQTVSSGTEVFIHNDTCSGGSKKGSVSTKKCHNLEKIRAKLYSNQSDDASLNQRWPF